MFGKKISFLFMAFLCVGSLGAMGKGGKGKAPVKMPVSTVDARDDEDPIWSESSSSGTDSESKEETGGFRFSKKVVRIAKEKRAAREAAAVAPLIRAVMSPNIQPVVEKLIHDETSGIKVATYLLTLYPVAQALAGKQQAGIPVTLVVDNASLAKDFRTPVKHILESGAVVRQNDATKKRGNPNFQIMHHKFWIFNQQPTDKKVLVSGSWNCTYQANQNLENVILTDNATVIAAFETEFADLLDNYTVPVTPAHVALIATCKDRTANPTTRGLHGIPEPLPLATPKK